MPALIMASIGGLRSRESIFLADCVAMTCLFVSLQVMPLIISSKHMVGPWKGGENKY